MKPDDIVCQCFQVTRRKLENFARIEQPRRAGQMSECFGAGTGCGWCRPMLKAIFFKAVSSQAIDAGEPLAAESVYPTEGVQNPEPPGCDTRATREAAALLGLTPDEAIRRRRAWIRERGLDDPAG